MKENSIQLAANIIKIVLVTVWAVAMYSLVKSHI